MPYLLLSDRFYSAPEVIAAGNRLIGVWVRMASWQAAYMKYDIHPFVRRAVGGKPRDIKRLIELGFLVEAPEGWRLPQSELWRFGNAVVSDGRPARPPIPPNIRSAVFERDGLLCPNCGATDDLTLDHIIPWSHGGPDTIANLRVLCRPCNSRRGNRVEVDV